VGVVVLRTFAKRLECDEDKARFEAKLAKAKPTAKK